MSTPFTANGQAFLIDSLEVYDAIQCLLHPTDRHEIRALGPGDGQSRSKVTWRGDPDAVKTITALADANGVYFTLNPVRADLGDKAASAADILERRNLLIDCDPVKSVKDAMATDKEKAHAWDLGSRVREYLASRGWPDPAVIDSGNGMHLEYLIALPNDEASKVLIAFVLHELADRFNTPCATVDVKVADAPRIAKLPGTWVRKGADTPERPHRMAHLVFMPQTRVAVTREQLEALVTPPAPPPMQPPVSPPTGGHWNLTAGGDLTVYVQRAIDGELADLKSAGLRNNALNAVAFNLSQLEGWPEFDGAAVKSLLRETALAIGLGAAETDKTIASGWKAGSAQPRSRPAPKVKQVKSVLDPKNLLVRADLIVAKDVVWMWPNRIPCGFLTVFAGRTGVGKSFVAFDIVARVTTGREWPDQSGNAPMGNVVIFSEDPQASMSVPRLRTMGADLSKVFFATWEAMTEFELHKVDMLELIIAQAGMPNLILIDPPQNFLGKTDENSNVQVRKVLMQLVKWIDTRPNDISIILITQVNKGGQEIAAVDRILGSVAWAATSRIAHTFAPDKDVKSGGFFSCPKTNLGEVPATLKYHFVKVGKQAKVEWDGITNKDADEVMQAPAKKTAADKAKAWITERFREKREWLSEELTTKAKEAGISRTALWSDDIKDLPIRRHQPGHTGPWYWTAQPEWPT